MRKNRLMMGMICAGMMLAATGCSGSGAAATTAAPATTAAAATAAEAAETTAEAAETTAEAAAETEAAEAAAGSEAGADTSGAVADADEEEAWKQEPAYGQTIYYYVGDACCSGPAVAEQLGYYEEAGLTVEGYKGTSYTEALGSNAAQLAIGHIATMLVPSTNGVDLTFVGGAHIGCKTLFVLGDSEYQTTEDLKGLKVAVPNGIGASDYNITARFFDADGINPLTDVNLTQVESGACVASMQNGEIAAALLSDNYAYDMIKDGTLRPVRSLLDEDFSQEPCCVIAMNATFVKENPITSRKMMECVQKAHEWMRNNTEEATQLLLDIGLCSGDFDKNLNYLTSLQFGLEDEFTESALSEIVDDYVRLGFITAMDDHEEIMNKVWSPLRETN